MSLLPENHPDFFEVLITPRAYTTLAYLLLSLATGILLFTFTVTGLSLSLGLVILIVGVPFTLGFLFLARLLSIGELHLLRVLVDREGPEAPNLLPAGDGWLDRIKSLIGDRRTWTSLLYFILQMPLGVASFTLMVTFLITGIALLVAPLAPIWLGPGAISLDGLTVPWLQSHPAVALGFCAILGALLVILTFHLALLLGRFQTWLAGHLLVR